MKTKTQLIEERKTKWTKDKMERKQNTTQFAATMLRHVVCRRQVSCSLMVEFDGANTSSFFSFWFGYDGDDLFSSSSEKAGTFYQHLLLFFLRKINIYYLELLKYSIANNLLCRPVHVVLFLVLFEYFFAPIWFTAAPLFPTYSEVFCIRFCICTASDSKRNVK